MKSIGFKNFRKFEDFKSMQLGPVTLLVGGNNAGKSTVGKAVRLLMGNLGSLQEIPYETSDGGRTVFGTGRAMFRFDIDPQIRIHSFKEALRHAASRREMEFSASVGDQDIRLVVSNTTESLPYGEVDVLELTDYQENCRFEVSSNEGTMRLVRIGDEKKQKELQDSIIERMAQVDSFHHELMSLEQSVYKMQKVQTELAVQRGNIQAQLALLDRTKVEDGIEPEDYQKQYLLLQDQLKILSIQTDESFGRFNEMLQRREDIEASLAKLNMFVASKKDALKLLEEGNGEVLAEYPIGIDYGSGSNNMLVLYADGFAQKVYTATRQKSESEIKEEFEKKYKSAHSNLEEEALREEMERAWEDYRLELEEEEPDDSDDRQDLPEVAKIVRRMISHYLSTMATHQVRYIEAHEAEQDTYYRKSDGRWFSSVLDTYVNKRLIRKEHPEHRLVVDWLKELEIATDFRINVTNNEVFEVELRNMSGEWVNLAELGKGAIQYFTLLLNLAVIIREFRGRQQKPTVLIEEPEQNMHPNWQSKLAELFNELSQKQDKYGLDKAGLKFLIETHSEYLVRKTQVLVGDMNFKDQDDLNESCPFATYYLGPNEPGGCGARKYNLAGQITKPFGEGFYDEAANMDYQIFRNERELKKN